MKIFLRSDIWNEITAETGFREASHISRKLDIKWTPSSLLNLVVSRAARNEELLQHYADGRSSVMATLESQRRFFDRMVPKQVDVGKNPMTFDWILGRVKDGTGRIAPREVIHLLTEARNEQIEMLDRGENIPPGEELITRSALRAALAPVSITRTQQTLYAEYPSEKPWIQKLEGTKAAHSVASLADIWGVDTQIAEARATRLKDIGLFEKRGKEENLHYWVPFLYRVGLDLKQGSAES